MYPLVLLIIAYMHAMCTAWSHGHRVVMQYAGRGHIATNMYHGFHFESHRRHCCTFYIPSKFHHHCLNIIENTEDGRGGGSTLHTLPARSYKIKEKPGTNRINANVITSMSSSTTKQTLESYILFLQ